MIVLQTKQEYLLNKNKLNNVDKNNIVLGTRKKKEQPGYYVGIINEKLNIIDIYLIQYIIKFNSFRNKEDNTCFKCRRNKLIVGNKIFIIKYDMYLKTHNLIHKISFFKGTILCPFYLNKLEKYIIFNNTKNNNTNNNNTINNNTKNNNLINVNNICNKLNNIII